VIRLFRVAEDNQTSDEDVNVSSEQQPGSSEVHQQGMIEELHKALASLRYEMSSSVDMIRKLLEHCITISNDPNHAYCSVPNDIEKLLFGVSDDDMANAVNGLESVSKIASNLDAALSKDSPVNNILRDAGFDPVIVSRIQLKNNDNLQLDYAEHFLAITIALSQLQMTEHTDTGQCTKVVERAIEYKLLNTGKTKETPFSHLNKGEDKPDILEGLESKDKYIDEQFGYIEQMNLLPEQLDKMGVGGINFDEFVNGIINIPNIFSNSVEKLIDALREAGAGSEEAARYNLNKLAIWVATSELATLDVPKDDLEKLQNPDTQQKVLNKYYSKFKDVEDATQFLSAKKIIDKITLDRGANVSDIYNLMGMVENSGVSGQVYSGGGAPIVDNTKVASMTRAILHEARKVSEFLFWQIFSSTPSVYTRSKKSFGDSSGTPNLSASRRPDSYAYIKAVSSVSPILIGATSYNYHSEKNRNSKLDFRVGIFNRLAKKIGDTKNTNIDIHGPTCASQNLPSEFVLTEDKESRNITTMPYDRLIPLCSELRIWCDSVPEWVEGGRFEWQNMKSVHDHMYHIFSAFTYHSNVETILDGRNVVWTLYDALLASILSSNSTVEKKKELISGLIGVSCPWGDEDKLRSLLKDIDDNKELSSVLGKNHLYSKYPRMYSARTVEPLVLLSQSVLYLYKTYCNLAGLFRKPDDPEIFVQSLTLSGDNIVEIFINRVIEQISKLIESHSSDVPNIHAVREFNNSEDKILPIFGISKDSMISAIYRAVVSNIGDLLYGEGAVFNARERMHYRNSSQYRATIGNVADSIARNTGVFGRDIFDISESLASKGVNTDMSGIYKAAVGRSMKSVRKTIRTSDYSSKISGLDIYNDDRRSLIKLPDNAPIPKLLGGTQYSLLRQDGTVIDSVVCDTRPFVTSRDGALYVVIIPKFSKLNDHNINSVYELVADYGIINPDSDSYAMQKICTGKYMVYSENISKRFEEFKSAIDDLKAKAGAIKAVNIYEINLILLKFANFKKAIHNAILALRSINTFNWYEADVFGDTGAWSVENLNKSIKDVEESLKSMVTKLKNIIVESSPEA